jgi:hypothetical protein
MSCSGIAFAVALVWLIFMQFFSGILVWSTVIIANLVTPALSIYVWLMWYNEKYDRLPTLLFGNKTIETPAIIAANFPSTSYNLNTIMTVGNCSFDSSYYFKCCHGINLVDYYWNSQKNQIGNSNYCRICSID